METKPSAYHLTSVALLADGPLRTSLTVIEGSLELIQEAIQLFGGEVYTTEVNDQETHFQIYSCSKVGNTELWIHLFATRLQIMLQTDAFRARTSIFEKGTQLTIIDNQYLVLSDATK